MAIRTRSFGQAYTVLEWRDQVMGMVDAVNLTSVQPVAEAIDIQPINAQRPIEIVTAGAHRHGELQMTILELYGTSIWQRIADFTDCQDIVDVMRTVQALDPPGIVISKVVRPPQGGEYRERFFNCTVTNIDDSENFTIATLTVPKTMTIWYTHSSKSWINGGQRKFPAIDIAPAM